MHFRRRTCCSCAPVTTPRRPPTAASCLPPAQPGRPSERQGGPAASGDRRQLRVPKAVTGCGAALEEQQWAVYCGGCTPVWGGARGRAGWQAMVRREGRHSSSQTADSCSTETPTPCRGGRNWPSVNSHILTCINERVESYYEI